MWRQESFACVHKGQESKPHCAQIPAQNLSSRKLYFSSRSHDGFATKANGSVRYSADVCCLFCGLGRKLP